MRVSEVSGYYSKPPFVWCDQWRTLDSAKVCASRDVPINRKFQVFLYIRNYNWLPGQQRSPTCRPIVFVNAAKAVQEIGGKAALRHNYQFFTNKKLKVAILGPQQGNRVIKHSPDGPVEGIAPDQPFLHGGEQNRNLPQQIERVVTVQPLLSSAFCGP